MKKKLVLICIIAYFSVLLWGEYYVPQEAPIASKLIVFNGNEDGGPAFGSDLDITGSFSDWKLQGESLFEVSSGIWLGFLRVYEGDWTGVQIKTKGSWDSKWDLLGNSVSMGGSTLSANMNESKSARLVFFNAEDNDGISNDARFYLSGLPGGRENLYRIDDKSWVGLVHADPGTYSVQIGGVGTHQKWSLDGVLNESSSLNFEDHQEKLPQLIVFDNSTVIDSSVSDELDVTGDFIEWNENGFPLTKINERFHIGLIWAEKDVWFLQVKTKGTFEHRWDLEGNPLESEDGSKLWLKSISR